ncbi:cupin domain-containing protein [Kitasatospora sp. NBC_01300]|uniref:cupin domain-containing protein n=1 Tax=Kitasatospora sp. NBC_01300 TaxID=2903574 RepID=UPI00352FE71E|nr:cupin domain-containing protein [Kitasatospora sp. NBC_01300]WSK08224.1 cupin domain-containing protein [Kitasatospora sp. NBC_01300]
MADTHRTEPGAGPGRERGRGGVRREPVALAPGQGGRRHVPGSPYVVKLAGAQSGGSIAVLESTFEPGQGAPLHLHRGHDETFYVVSGAFRLRCDEHTTEAGPGAFLHVPRTHPHSFTAIGDTPATILVTLTPAGFEEFFIEAAALAADGRPDRRTMQTLLARHDQELVPDAPRERHRREGR